MELQLKRPLVFFDLESTGPDRARDRITQYCFHVFLPDGESHVFESIVNPEMPIPEHVAKLTGITDEIAQKYGAFRHHAAQVFELVHEVDLVGFGCLQFDVPLLFAELHREGYVWDYTKSNIIDACNIYKRQVPRDLSSALLYYAGKQLRGAHNATADVDATREVFLRQLEKHELTQDLEALALYSNYDKHLVDLNGKFVYNDKGEVLLNFGGKKGEKAREHIGLLHWMLDKDFSEDVKMICRNLIAEDNERFASELAGVPDLPF